MEIMCLISGFFMFVIWAATLFFGVYAGYRMRVEDEQEGKPPYEFSYVKEISGKKDGPAKPAKKIESGEPIP